MRNGSKSSGAANLEAYSNWTDIGYLQQGTRRQKEAYQALIDLNILTILADYNPLLVGTLPLDIDIPSSDLDIICHVPQANLTSFAAHLQANFGQYPNFSTRRRERNQLPVIICNFDFATFPIEVFGQPRPVTQNNAYLHMLAEARLLALAGDAARETIRNLKREGLKTEPAYGVYFNLEGDPYERLLTLAHAPVEMLKEIVRRTQG